MYQVIETSQGLSVYWQRGASWVYCATLVDREAEQAFVQQAGLVLACEDRCGSWPRRVYRDSVS